MIALFFAMNVQANTEPGQSVLVGGSNGLHQLIVTGKPAEAIYKQIKVTPTRDSSSFDQVMIKVANQISCSFYVRTNEYGCSIFVSSLGVVKY